MASKTATKRTQIPTDIQDNQTANERWFGMTFTVIFSAVAIAKSYDANNYLDPLCLAPFSLALTFLVLAIFFPRSLQTLNKGWQRFGLLLARILNPIIMGFVFFLAVVPVALIMRLCRNDPLSLKFEPKAKTYWQKKAENLQNMKNQF